MCDYSLHGVASRPAKVGDRLVTTKFCNTATRGFSAVGEPDVAVCLTPGTELAFEAEVERNYPWLQMLLFGKDKWNIPHKVGRFHQINVDNPTTHHDAIEFPDGRVLSVTRLRPGQRATVLQLPARTHAPPEANIEQRPASPALAH